MGARVTDITRRERRCKPDYDPWKCLHQNCDRIRLLSQHLKESVFVDVSRGLWTKDALVFQVMLAHRVWQARGLDSMGNLWRAFCSGIPGGLQELAQLGAFSLLKERMSWGSVAEARKIRSNDEDEDEDGNEEEDEKYSELLEEIRNVQETGEVPAKIELFAAAENTHCLRVDESNADQIEAVEEVGLNLCRLLVILALRPDRAAAAAKQFARKHLGFGATLRQQEGAIEIIDHGPLVPTILILPSTRDGDGVGCSRVFAIINKVAQARSSKLLSVAMGPGQGILAQRCFEDALEKRCCCLLENCHLAEHWMPTLVKMVANVDPDPEQEGVPTCFRLYLSTESSPSFPVLLFEKGSKVAMQPPRGLRGKVTRALAELEWGKAHNIGEEDEEEDSGRINTKQAMYALCCFHAVVTERQRAYGCVG